MRLPQSTGPGPRSRVQRALVGAALAVTFAAGGCAAGSANTASGTSEAGGGAASVSAAATGTLWDTSTVHTVSIEADQTQVSTLIETYLTTGEKEWMSATVTIDGVTYENVGIKLKGNSSLRSISADTPLADLPWRIRLDKYVEGQNADGVTDVTVRSNNSETSLNEAVALDLLAEAGLASEQAAATSFTVNGSEARLRLIVENLNEEWVAENFPDAGEESVLYKAEAQGSWEYLGEDADYSDSFDLEVGPDNYEPLIELLDLLANGTEEEVAEQLPQLVDIDSLATYLALQDLIDNSDDIDGPGNNSYLFWDSTTQQFTVVAWDHNLAFGAQMGPGGEPGDGAGPQMPDGATSDTESGDAAQGEGEGQVPAAPQDGEMPDGSEMPEGFQMPEDGEMPSPPGGFEMPQDGEMPELPDGAQMPNGGGFGGGGPGGGDGFGGENPLVAAMEANEDWAGLITEASERLQADLIDSGALAASVESWESLLLEQASDLVPAGTIESEADSILRYADPDSDFTSASPSATS